MAYIGIDLGTTYSLISYFKDGCAELIPNSLGDHLTPSVVSMDGDKLLCGEAAKSRLVTHPEHSASVFKRMMGSDKHYKLGGKFFSPPELSAVVLRSLKEDAEVFFDHEITDVVISVPAYFNDIQRKAVDTAGRMAGLNPLRLINEPTAAALAYGLHDLAEERTFLVFDLGGGTFDVSILEVFEGVMEVKATAGDAYLGGEDFTRCIAKSFEEKLGDTFSDNDRAALHKIAEKVKISLSSNQFATVDAQIGDAILIDEISRTRFEELTSKLLARLRRPVERTLYDSRLSHSDIDRIVLVGGASRMPIARSIAGKLLRKLPESYLDPDKVVAMGAAIQAALIGEDKALDDIVMTDVSAFTLGIDVCREVGNTHRSGYYLPIIERNSVVPISREESLITTELGQSAINFGIYQGEAPVVSSNIKLGDIRVPVPKNREKHEAVTIRFTYDVSGLLEVDTTVESTGEKKNILIKKLAGNVSEKEIDKALEKLSKLKQHPRDKAENVHLRSKLELCYAMARFDDREGLQQLLIEFDTAIERQILSEIDQLREGITTVINDFENGYVQ